MKQSIERMAKTVDEAIQLGLSELGITEDEALIEVLDEGEAGGLLGFGRRPALVRVSRVDEMGELLDDEADDAELESDEAELASEEEDFACEADDEQEDLEEAGAWDENDRSSRRGHGRRREREEDSRRVNGLELDEEEKVRLENLAVDFVTNVLGSLDIHGKISTFYDSEGCLRIEVSGRDIGNAIGRRGETLEALQYLTTLAVNRQRDDYLRVILDIGQYRERRVRSLRQQARRSAGRVLHTGRRVVMDPMSASERRQIHMALADFEGVTTYSEGAEPNRCVVIAPDDEH